MDTYNYAQSNKKTTIMNPWITIPSETKRRAYVETAEKTGLSAFAAEKDWWVVQTLSVVFGMDVSAHLVFKGGTSLSKGWKIIERFSEDVDLALDRAFLGFDGELSKKQRGNLRKETGLYVDGVFYPELISKFEQSGFADVRFELVEEKESDRDRKIIIYYPNVIDAPGYLQPAVQIEISCRSLREPFTMRNITPYLDEVLPDTGFIQTPAIIPTVNPERTFLEKIFLLHEEFHRPAERRRVNRLSRHLYDVVKLSRTSFAEKALSDRALYETIVNHRYCFTRVGEVNYNLHQPQTINPIPPEDLMEAWKADYNVMIEQMIYEENPPGFGEVISDLKNLTRIINSVEWKFSMEFPKPATEGLGKTER